MEEKLKEESKDMESAEQRSEEEPQEPQGKPEEELQEPQEDIIEMGKGDKGRKGSGGKAGKKIAGFIELAISLFLVVLSVWMFMNTRGTRLLYISMSVGYISRYYWIFFAAAAVFTLLGAVTLKHAYRIERKNMPGSLTAAEEDGSDGSHLFYGVGRRNDLHGFQVTVQPYDTAK